MKRTVRPLKENEMGTNIPWSSPIHLFTHCLVAVSLSALVAHVSFADEISVLTWDGAYQRGLHEAVIAPFEESTGIATDLVPRDDPFQIPADIIERRKRSIILTLSAEEQELLCNAQLLGRLDVEQIGAFANRSFPPATGGDPRITECGLAFSSISFPIVANFEAFQENTPLTTRDFFDVENFPGKRGLRYGPKHNLELALLVDDVPPGDVYKLLAESEGRERAFGKLDEIKDSIIWWNGASEAIHSLVHKKVVMSSIPSYGIEDLVKNAPNSEVFWDDITITFDYLALGLDYEGNQHAYRFIAFTTDEGVQTKFANALNLGRAWSESGCPNGECECSGTNICSKSCCHSITLVVSPAFWREHGQAIQWEFDDWLTR